MEKCLSLMRKCETSLLFTPVTNYTYRIMVVDLADMQIGILTPSFYNVRCETSDYVYPGLKCEHCETCKITQGSVYPGFTMIQS